MDTASSKSLASAPSMVKVLSSRRSFLPFRSASETASGMPAASRSASAGRSVAKSWSSATARISASMLEALPSTRSTLA